MKPTLLVRSLFGSVALLMAGCAIVVAPRLVPGQSTAAQVETAMGQPAERLAAAGGDTVWFYPKGLASETIAVQIRPDGIVRDIEQRLTTTNVAKIVVGRTTSKEVRALLGPPGKVSRLDLSARDEWEYQMAVGYEFKILSLQISSDGIVRDLFLQTDRSRYDDSGEYM